MRRGARLPLLISIGVAPAAALVGGLRARRTRVPPIAAGLIGDPVHVEAAGKLVASPADGVRMERGLRD